MGGRTWARWTPDEDELVRRHYPGHGATWDGWAELLPAHPKAPAIRSRATKLGVRAGRGVQHANMLAARERSHYGSKTHRSHVLRQGEVKVAKARRKRWTDRQRLAMVGHLRDMCRETGHTLNECCAEWNRLLDARKGE